MKTILFLRGPVRLRETLALGFLGDNDAEVNLVPCVDEGGAHWETGLINPERSTLLLNDPLPRSIRSACIQEGLKQPEVDLVIVQAPGAAYKSDCLLSSDLRHAGHRVVWAFVGPPMTSLKERARQWGVEIVDLQPGRAWTRLCQYLRIPV